MDDLILAQRPDVVLFNKKRGICRLVDFDIPADNNVEIR